MIHAKLGAVEGSDRVAEGSEGAADLAVATLAHGDLIDGCVIAVLFPAVFFFRSAPR